MHINRSDKTRTRITYPVLKLGFSITFLSIIKLDIVID